MNVLLDRTETLLVRGQGAECTGCPVWCVFALGQIDAFSRRRLKRAGIRALEARLDDWAKPEVPNYWPIRFEALARL